MKGKIRSTVVNLLTNTIGRILVILRPKKVNELSEKGITLVWGDNLTSTERLMRRFILQKMEKNNEHDALAELHKTYWTKQGDDFVNNTENKLENTNLPAYKAILDVLKKEIAEESVKFQKLIEIGTGNGSVLNNVSMSFTNVKEFVGIDLSEPQSQINKIKYKDNPKLEFVGGDVLDWIENKEQGNMVFLTFRGVLEYFTQQQLVVFFEKLNSLGNIIFFAIEPTDSDHNYNKHPDSKVYGVEGSFSHNYEKLFKDAGFKIWYSEQKEESWHTNVMRIIGVKNF